MMLTMVMTVTIMLKRLKVMYIRLRTIDDAFMEAKFDDFAKRDGRTKGPTDGPTDQRTDRHTGL